MEESEAIRLVQAAIAETFSSSLSSGVGKSLSEYLTVLSDFLIANRKLLPAG